MLEERVDLLQVQRAERVGQDHPGDPATGCDVRVLAPATSRTNLDATRAGCDVLTLQVVNAEQVQVRDEQLASGLVEVR